MVLKIFNYRFYDSIKKENSKEIKGLVKVLNKEIKENYGNNKIILIKKCLKESIKTHKKKYRKTGGLYIKHPLEMALDGLNYGIDYITLNGILLHDTIEEVVDEEINLVQKNISKIKKNKLRVKLRNKNLNILNKDLVDFLGKNLKQKRYKEETKSLINLVSKVSRYKTEKQTYYDYLKNIFSERFTINQRKIYKLDIERAIIVKLLDRKNNTKTFYHKKEKPNLNKLNLDFKKIIKSDNGKYLKNLFFKKIKNNLKLKDSINGQKRLYNIWKNIYLINQTRDYIDHSKASIEIKKINGLLSDLIKTTIKEIKLNKYILRFDKDLSLEYILKADNEILKYELIGGLEKITKNKQYSSLFDGTINRYTLMIHEDEKEIKYTGRNKKIQYLDTIAFERILRKMLKDKNYKISGVENLL